MNKKFDLFIPITKVDEENRLVYGVIACEEVDNSGEIFDYESSKPNFEKWSEAQFEASGGLSKGNVREMHTSTAAGKLTDLSFSDETKVIEGCAKVVDDGAWNKVLEGVYTGFSMGGRYEKRWNDNGTMRYTALPVEVSLVDKPCIKSALFGGMLKGEHTFLLQKADGTTEERPLHIDMSALEKGHETQNRNDSGKWSGGHKHETTTHGGSDPTGHGEEEAAPTVKTGALGLAIDKSDKGDTVMYVPTNDEILPVAQSLAKAAGKTDADWLEFVEPATAQLVAEKGDNPFATHSDDNCKVDNCDKCAEKAAAADDDAAKADTGDVVAVEDTTVIEDTTGGEGVAKAAGGPDEGDHSGEGDQEPAANADDPANKSDTPAEPVQGWQASDGTFFAKKADCAAHNVKLAKGDVAPSLTELLDGALAIAKGDIVIPEAVVEDQPLGKSIDTQLLELAAFIDGPDMRKGLYDVSSLTSTLRYAASAYASARNEAAREGDGSGVPALLLDATEKLGQALIDMATEEVGEMLTELREAGDSADTYVYPDCCYLSASTMGLEKADADEFFAKALGTVEKRGPRLAKGDILGQPVEDDLSKAVRAAGFDSPEAFVAGIADLQKKAGELADIAPKVEELTKFITDLKSKPMPKAPTTTMAVEKSIDANPAGGGGGSGAISDIQKAEQALAGLSPEEISRLAIKMSHASGGVKLQLG